MARKTFAETLQEQRTLIFNSSKPEIAPKLDAMGITAEHLTIGEALHNDVTELNSNQDKEEQESRRAYDIFHEEMSECASDASINYRIIKMASRSDKDLQNRLKLYEPKEYKIEAWIKQTVNFYNRVLNEETLLSSINKYGVTAERLNEQISSLEKLKSLRNEAKSEEGQAQEATPLFAKHIGKPTRAIAQPRACQRAFKCQPS
jgi:hypothetical protein